MSLYLSGIKLSGTSYIEFFITLASLSDMAFLKLLLTRSLCFILVIAEDRQLLLS